MAAKGLGSAKVEQVGAAPTRAAEPTQVGELDRSPSSPDSKSSVSLSISENGETERVGHYEVVGTLGRGGMGVVYEVVDQSTGFIYALKTIETRFLKLPDSNAGQRFRQEIQVLERLDHPSVVRLYDSGFARHPLGYDLAFFVMERLDGDTLDRDVKAGKVFTVEETLDTMAQLIDALDYLKEHSVLHRDIKPGNIFREVGGRVVLMDFGLARSEEFTRLTLAGQIVGTFGYMSPERLTGRAFDICSDVYALGVVFFQMLAGAHPFPAPSPTETLEAIKRGLQFTPAFETIAHSEEVKRLIRWMLTYKAEDRPKPAVLRDELAKLLGEPAMKRTKRGRITRTRKQEETTAAPVPVPSSTKTLARAVKSSPGDKALRPPSGPKVSDVDPEPILTTPNTASSVTPIIHPPDSQAAHPLATQQQLLSGMAPLAPPPQPFISTSGPTWAAAGLLTIAATCVAFLAGLIVGRSQEPAPVASHEPVVIIADKVEKSAKPAVSQRPEPQKTAPSAVSRDDDGTTTPPSQFTDANAAFVYAELLIDHGRYRPAIEILKRALELNPAYANAHRRLGDAHAGLGEMDRAAMHYKSYLALRPAAPDAAEVKRLLRDIGP